MSKTNLLIHKRVPVISVNKQKNPSQHTITHRQASRDDDSQKLYTFCSSQQKQAIQAAEQESRDISRDRKISFNNVRGKVYQPLSKSKGKTVSQVSIYKERKKQANNYSMTNNNSLILNNSALVERRKTDKMTAREEKKEDNRINISINLTRNCVNEPMNKENKFQANNIPSDKLVNDKKSVVDTNFLKQKDSVNQSGKRMIVMSEEELHNFTKKQANDKIRLQQTIQSLEENLKKLQEKETEWNHFKKDSEDYIKYLIKEKETAVSHYQALQKEINALKNDKEYYSMAKEEYRCTIREQENQIHNLKQELENVLEEVRTLQQELEKNPAYSSSQNQSTVIQMMEIENLHLKRQLSLAEKHKSDKNSHFLQIQKLQRQLEDLKVANNLLSSQMKESCVLKLKYDVLQKALHQSNSMIDKLLQQNQSLMGKVQKTSKFAKIGDGSRDSADFEFRLDTSPHSPSEVEVVWKRGDAQNSDIFTQSKRVQDYFDHDFFFGEQKQTL